MKLFQKVFLLIIFSLAFAEKGDALSSVDTFIETHCGGVCNGESDECSVCYNQAIDLFQQPTSHPDTSGLTLEFD